MRKLLVKSLFLLPIPLVMIAVSVAGDPAHLFSGGRYEQAVATLLLQGKNVAGVANYDERLLQRHYAQGLSGAKDVLVLGSSRSMSIAAPLFPGESFFNCSVSGATLEDLVGIYQLHRCRGHLPRRVVLGLDPWLLNRNHGQSRWKTLAGEYRSLAALLTPEGAGAGGDGAAASFAWKRYGEALSPDYFRQSLKSLARGKGGGEATATGDLEGESDIKAADGTLHYKRSFSKRSLAEVEAEAVRYAEAPSVYSLGGFEALDPTQAKLLERFVELLQQERVSVSFYLAPYHPQSYRRIVASPKYRMLPEAESFYRALAGRHGITVRGSYDPVRLALSGADFHDGMHPTAQAAAKIMLSPPGAPSL